jgi:hypothetical protein
MTGQAPGSAGNENRVPDPAIVYLDQHIWIGLLRGSRDDDPVAIAALSALRAALNDGLVVVPLSAAHYLETWNRKSEKSRHELAALMRDLSGYKTMAPLQKLQRIEVERAIVRRVDELSSAPDRRAQFIGYGACHAFDSPTGRFRFVESIATKDEPEGPAVPTPELLSTQTLAGEEWEWLNLAGPQELLELDGVDVTPEHRLGDKYVENELATRRFLATEDLARERLADFMVMQELIDLLPIINDVCERLNVDPRPMLAGNPSSGRSFINDVSTSAVLAALRTLRHRNMSHPWMQHDRTDLIAMSVAVPYSDIVVTERQWCHLIKVARLDRDFGTAVTATIADLPVLLSNVGSQ